MTVPTLAPLTSEQVQFFEQQGYLLLKGVLTRQEAQYYRNHILDMVPRDLTLPKNWYVIDGRMKPVTEDNIDNFDTPELLPLFFNERLYGAVSQLLSSPRIQVFDGTLSITLRNSGGSSILSQTLHLDASVPKEQDDFLFTPAELQVGGCYYFSDVQEKGGGIHIVPGGHLLVQERARAVAGGRHLYHNWSAINDFPETIEVTGEAGDFALLHHLMPHAASHNRRPAPRVAQFTRFIRDDHPYYPASKRTVKHYNERQLRVMTPLGRKLLGLDPWE